MVDKSTIDSFMGHPGMIEQCGLKQLTEFAVRADSRRSIWSPFQ
jgi:hypothetical protein